MASQFDVERLHDLMEAIPAGRWITYGDLAQGVGTIGRGLGSHIRSCTTCPHAWRVVEENGVLPPGFIWSNRDERRSQADVLRAEGVDLRDGRAAPERRIQLDALVELARFVVDFPTVEYVKDPVDLAGTATGRPIAMRHFERCEHWYRETDGTTLLGGPARLATDIQMQSLPPCKDCAGAAKRAGHPSRGVRSTEPVDERRFWWVSQGYNHEVAIAQGTLWSLPKKGRDLPDRRLLKDMRPGDVVLHYADRYLRAVSVVTKSWQSASRPPGYRMRENDGNDGWLVEVDIIQKDLELDFSRIAELIPHGSPGPLGRSGVPLQKYVAPLSRDAALRLLGEMAVAVPRVEASEAVFGLPSIVLDGDETDSIAMTRVRREQTYLREALLNGRSEAGCGLCGRTFPGRLLIAAHIYPRRHLSDAERRDVRSAAILACALGCDALFEWGHIVVNADGRIEAPQRSMPSDLNRIIVGLVGRKVDVYNEHTAFNFERHRALHI